MEATEMMTNEVMEATEETIVNNSMKTLKTLGIVGGVLLTSGLAYKYAIKPMINKYKDSKNVNDESTDADETNCDEMKDSEEE